MKREITPNVLERIANSFIEPITTVRNDFGEIVPATKNQMIKNTILLLGFAAGLGYASYQSVSHLGQAFESPGNFPGHIFMSYLNQRLYTYVGKSMSVPAGYGDFTLYPKVKA